MANIIKIKKHFFYLIEESTFSFESNNIFDECSNISLQVQTDTDFQRNISNSAIISSKPEKFQLSLSGVGKLGFFDKKELFFVSSLLDLKFINNNTREIAFNYLFNKKNIPYENQVSNFEENKDKEDMHFLPVLKVLITQRVCVGNTWKLKLEEI